MIARERRATWSAAGREVIFDAEHFFDGWKHEPPSTPCSRSQAAAEAGARLVVLCDTNGGSMPEEIAAITARGRRRGCRVPVGIHCHNDCDLAVANSLAAVDAGAVPRAGHDQRLRRALRQRRPDLGHRQPGRQEAGLRGARRPAASST